MFLQDKIKAMQAGELKPSHKLFSGGGNLCVIDQPQDCGRSPGILLLEYFEMQACQDPALPASHGAGCLPPHNKCLRIHGIALDRKSTRLNSSHITISYAVFCL